MLAKRRISDTQLGEYTLTQLCGDTWALSGMNISISHGSGIPFLDTYPRETLECVYSKHIKGYLLIKAKAGTMWCPSRKKRKIYCGIITMYDSQYITMKINYNFTQEG